MTHDRIFHYICINNADFLISYFCNIGCFKNVKHWGVSIGRFAGLQFLFYHMEFSSRSVPTSFAGKIFLTWNIYYLVNLTPKFQSFCLTWESSC